MALSQRQVSPIPHNCITIAPIFLDLLNILCASCVLTPYKSFLLGLFFFHFSPIPAHCKPEHSTARQSSAQQSLPPSTTEQQLTQRSYAHRKTTHTHTHTLIAQHGTAQPCSIAHSREVPHTPQSTPEHKSIPVAQQHTAEHAQRPVACTQRTAQHNCNTT